MSNSVEHKKLVTGRRTFALFKSNIVTMTENRKILKKTNSHQFSKLVQLMEANPDIAKGVGAFGSSKKNQKECWEVFAGELNCLGPPARDGKEWHKVWLDYKLKLKKKIASNKKELVATGGGPYTELSLSPLENAVNDLLGLQHAANPDGNAFGGSIPILPSPEEPVLEQNSTPSRPKRLSPTLNCDCTPSTTSQTLELLKCQTQAQADLLSAMNRIEESLAEIARYSRKSFDLKKEKLSLRKAGEIRKIQAEVDKNRRHKEKVEIKLKKIELKSLFYRDK